MANPIPLESGKYYHIYNRGNNREDIFHEERNYRYFMKLYAHHVGLIADTYAYCLLHNHFHLLVRIKTFEDLTLGDLSGLQLDPSRRFSNFFNAYARAFNLAYQRSGALFQRPFGRIEVTSEAYLHRLVVYIHRNPQRHGLTTDFRDWPYSSYRAFLADKPTQLRREEVLAWFGGASNLALMHGQDLSESMIAALAPDDIDQA